MIQLRLTGLSAAALGTGAMFVAPGAAAQTIDLTIEIPRLSVAEYHKPYVAVWLEKEGGSTRTLAVWYDDDMRGGEGTKWLRDVRQWWRASGRSMSFPADGVSSATKAPGTHRLRFAAGTAPMPRLSPGNYTLVVEAAREVGGRELLRLPFAWPAGGGATATANGSSELGAVRITVR